MNTVVALFLAALAFWSQALAKPNAEYSKHLHLVHQFKCGPPQPRAVDINTLHPLNSEDIYIPHMTVLHVCDRGSGCCTSDRFECSPLATEDVHLVFMVRTLFGNKAKRTSPARYETLTFRNHTQCSCQEIIDLPK